MRCKKLAFCENHIKDLMKIDRESRIQLMKAAMLELSLVCYEIKKQSLTEGQRQHIAERCHSRMVHGHRQMQDYYWNPCKYSTSDKSSQLPRLEATVAESVQKANK